MIGYDLSHCCWPHILLELSWASTLTGASKYQKGDQDNKKKALIVNKAKAAVAMEAEPVKHVKRDVQPAVFSRFGEPAMALKYPLNRAAIFVTTHVDNLDRCA